jgi:hypothetical protein
MSTEIVAVHLGRTLATRAVRMWLASREREEDANLDMEALVRRRIPGLRNQRSVLRQFEQFADAAAARIEPLLLHEYRELDDGERAAAIDAVARAFNYADLSDSAILGSSADPVRLARRVREAAPKPVGLGEAASHLYNLLIAECCECYVRALRRLPVFSERAVAELLSRVADLGAELSLLLERLPTRSLYAPDGIGEDEGFRREFLSLISRDLDEVELFSFAAAQQAPRTKLSMAYISLRVSTGSSADERGGQGSGMRGVPLRSGIGVWDSVDRDT